MELDSSLCPVGIASCPNKTVDLHIGQAVASYTSIAAGSLSCIGALLIIYMYFAYKDLRTSAQTVITLLAVADFILSVVVVASGVIYFIFFGEADQRKCQVYDILCTILAYILVWSAWSMFIWNSVLALHFCLLLFHRVTLANKLIPVYNIIGWGVPIGAALPLLVLGKLGKNPGEPEPICFIRVTPQTSTVEMAELLGFGVWLPEIISYFCIAMLYGIITVQICRKKLQGYLSRSAVPKRLLLIPLFYFAARIWDTVFFSILLANPIDVCSTTSIGRAVLDASNVIQVLGTGSQGFLNSILYVFASKEMRKRLFCTPLTRTAVNFRREAREQQEPINARSTLNVQREPPPQEGRTHTYFSIPTEFPHSDVGNARHTVKQNHQQANEINSFPTNTLTVEWSCTHLSLPSEFPSSHAKETELPPESQSDLEQSYTYFSLPSEFPSETKPK